MTERYNHTTNRITQERALETETGIEFCDFICGLTSPSPSSSSSSSFHLAFQTGKWGVDMFKNTKSQITGDIQLTGIWVCGNLRCCGGRGWLGDGGQRYGWQAQGNMMEEALDMWVEGTRSNCFVYTYLHSSLYTASPDTRQSKIGSADYVQRGLDIIVQILRLSWQWPLGLGGKCNRICNCI